MLLGWHKPQSVTKVPSATEEEVKPVYICVLASLSCPMPPQVQSTVSCADQYVYVCVFFPLNFFNT